MSSLLWSQVQEELPDLITETLEENHPITIPLHEVANAIDTATTWDQRVNAPCNRDPTVDIEPYDEPYAATPAANLHTTPVFSDPPSVGILSATILATRAPTHEAATIAMVQSAERNVQSSTTLLRERYQLDQAIATGGSATIYRARDSRHGELTATSSPVAVKLLQPNFRTDAKAIERLKREYEYTLTLIHPNIVRVLDLDHCDIHGWFITMELLDGMSLARLIWNQDGKPMALQPALVIITACAHALSFAHAHGVFHCDFKPSNVIVTKAKRVCVLDFGAAYTSTNTGSTAQKAAATTPAYASPQLLAGYAVDARDDLFSLACVTYELLTGRHPFGHSNTVTARNYERLIRPPQLSSRQWQALRRALSRDRTQRQASVAAFLKEFSAHSMHLLWWLSATAAALVIGGVGLLLSNSSVVHTLAHALPNARITKAASQAATLSPLPETTTTFTTTPAADAHRSTAALTAAAATQAQPTEHTTSPLREASRPRTARVATAEISKETLPALAFEQTKFNVSERAVAAALTLTRTDTNDDMRIKWRTSDDSAHAGMDYEPVTLSTAVFAKHQARRTLYVKLKSNPGAHSDRVFTVEVSKVAGGPLDVARAEVTIRSAESESGDDVPHL